MPLCLGRGAGKGTWQTARQQGDSRCVLALEKGLTLLHFRVLLVCVCVCVCVCVVWCGVVCVRARALCWL